MATIVQGIREKNSSSSLVIDYCTSIRTLPSLRLPKLVIPKDLKTALENNLKVTNNDTQKTRNYIKFLQSLSKIDKIQQENYLFLFKISLFVEDFTRSIKMRKHNIKRQKIRQNDHNKVLFHIFVPTLNIDDPFITTEDKVYISQDTDDTTSRSISCCAQITHIFNQNINIVVNKRFAKKYTANMKCNISFIYTNWCMKCYHYALHLIHYYNLVPLMYPTIGNHGKELILDLSWFNGSVGQNFEQRQAITNILNRTAFPAPYILFGPPGTGKTATLVELICQIWKQGFSKTVLVCASSNAAVNEITKRLLKYIPTKDIQRMYARSTKWCAVPSKIKPCSNFVNETCFYPSKNILLSKRIIVITLSACTRLLKANIRVNHFSYIIIDEASQAIEPETIIPFVLACTKNEENKNSLQAQVVMAGDPCQLGPYIHSKIVQSLLGKSMLERLMECPSYKRGEQNKYDPCYVTKLIKNYRSHKYILHVPNKEFYNNELVICGGSTINIAIGWKKLPNTKFPLIFHAANGKEERDEYSFSVCNREEISIVMKYLELLLGKKLGNLKIESKHIGIITPFKLQRIQIKKRLEEKGWINVEVGTVELFQGREKEIIILSTVRSRIFVHDGIQHIGFLSNEKRFNVAMTRAKSLLIVIGNPIILDTDKYWGLFIRYCVDNKAYIGDTSTFQQLSTKQELLDKGQRTNC